MVRIIVPDIHKLAFTFVESNKNHPQNFNVAEDSIPANVFLKRLELFERQKEDTGIINFVKRIQGNKNLHKWMYDTLLLGTLLTSKSLFTL